LWFHPSLISSPLVEPHWATCEEGRQGLLILASVVASAVNWLVVGPLASSTMFERHRLERLEGKEHDEPNVSHATQGCESDSGRTGVDSQVSEAMSKANKKFALLHGTASGLNLISNLALAGLGLAVSM
jgi:hypothetical protein